MRKSVTQTLKVLAHQRDRRDVLHRKILLHLLGKAARVLSREIFHRRYGVRSDGNSCCVISDYACDLSVAVLHGQRRYRRCVRDLVVRAKRMARIIGQCFRFAENIP